MKTPDLIATLAAEGPRPALSLLRIGSGIVAAVVLCAGLFLVLAGARDDLPAAVTQWSVAAKTLLPLALALIALPMALRSVRPGARLRPAWLALPAVAAATLWLWSYGARPPDARFADVTPLGLAECLGLIVLISAVPAAVALRLLRRGAALRPGLTGALAGLAVGGLSATGYSLFCLQDNPLFFVTWYGTAIGIVALGLALIARRSLRF